MAGLLDLRRGTRLQIGFDRGFGKGIDFNMFCTFGKALNEASVLVSIPMKDGKPLEVEETQKILFKYDLNGEAHTFAGYVDGVVKEGIRTYWKVRKVDDQRKFFQRADERINAALKVEYWQSTWNPGPDGTITPYEGMTLDISAGGIAMYLDRRFEVGEFIELKLPRVGLDPEGAAITDIVGVVCWNREAPKGSLHRNICGIQFKFGDGLEKERLQEYVDYTKKKFKL